MSDLLSHFDTQIQNQEQLLREREQELEQLRRQRIQLAELQTQRDELLSQLRALENDIALLERTMTSSLNRFSTLSTITPSSVQPSLTPVATRSPEPVVAPTPPPAAVVVATPAQPKTSTLREEIRKVLREAQNRITGPEITGKILASGYKTSSTNFMNVVKKTLFEMEDVSHVRGQGYKLKR
jgi:hypothetical protein